MTFVTTHIPCDTYRYGTGSMCAHLTSDQRDRFLSRLRLFKNEYGTCAVVGASGQLRNDQMGAVIDAHEAVIRVNSAPVSGYEEMVGSKTTWRVLSMDEYSSFKQYPKRWLKRHSNMSGAVSASKLAITCHWPFDGRCKPTRMRQVFHDTPSTYWIDPRMIVDFEKRHFSGIRQKTMNAGMVALLVANRMCKTFNVYGFSDGSCFDQCYHYYECKRDERHFYKNRGASNGYHNFGAHGSLLKNLSSIFPTGTRHSGTCRSGTVPLAHPMSTNK